MGALAGQRKRPWWTATDSIVGTVGLVLVVISPILGNAAGSNPTQHPTARVLADICSILGVIVLSVDVVGLLGVRWDRVALPAVGLTAAVAATLWVATRSGWTFLIFTAVGVVVLQTARPSKHRIE